VACVLAVADRHRRGDLGKVALIFAELAGHYAAWNQGLEGFDMTESKVVNEWIEEAAKERALATTRRLLLRLLNQRFPKEVPPEVIETFNNQPSLSLLEDWLDQVSRVASMADFVRVLRA
jgi:hypothetical protein